MKKILTIFTMILLLVSLLLVAGCGEEKKRTVVSKPVVAKEIYDNSVQVKPAQATYKVDTVSDPVKTQTVKTTTSTKSVSSTVGNIGCQQLTGADIGSVIGGTWSKTSDCPETQTLPGNVDVCKCSYSGPSGKFVDVETQTYNDEAEAIQIFKLYCDDESNEVGDMSCRRVRSSTYAPNFVYFLDNTYFVKVSCIGNNCPLDSIASLAKKVEAKI